MRPEEEGMAAGVGCAQTGADIAVQTGKGESAFDPRCREVHGVVLAGVHCWGHGVLESLVCRPLLPILNRPLISHVLGWLRTGGVDGVTTCANSDTAAIRGALGASGGAQPAITYYEDVMPRGPAGCIKDAAVGSQADVFVAVEGAVIPEINLRSLIDAHLESEAALTLVVSSARAKPDVRHDPGEPMGIYVFSPDSLAGVSPVGYQDVKEGLIPQLHRRGRRVLTYRVPTESVVRVTGAASYLAANRWALTHLTRSAAARAGYRRVGESWLHETALVDPTARLAGPVFVGSESIVQSKAMLTGPTTIGARCIIERDAVVSRSVLWNGVRVGAGAALDGCIVADNGLVRPGRVRRHTVCRAPNGLGRRILDRLNPSIGWRERVALAKG